VAASDQSRLEWKDLAALDPLFAVLSHRDKRGGAWDPAAFFATGEDVVARLLLRGAAFHRPEQWRRALDFGCGVGRLARALSLRFESVLGVDISSTMIEQARRHHAGWARCRFEVLGEAGLSSLPQDEFGCVLAKSVLQHLPSRAAMRSCLGDLARLLKPNGLLVVQVPSRLPWRRRPQLSARLYRLLRTAGLPSRLLYERLRLTPIWMRTLAAGEVQAALRLSGARLLAADGPPDAGPDEVYYATKDVRRGDDTMTDPEDDPPGGE
jgi:SAM-dependent methyltransferase